MESDSDQGTPRRVHEIAGLVPDSKHEVAEQSGHNIQLEQPQLVVAAIRDVVEAVRDPGTWKRS